MKRGFSPLFFARAPAVESHGHGRAVGGARWCYGMRAVFRRDCRGVRGYWLPSGLRDGKRWGSAVNPLRSPGVARPCWPKRYWRSHGLTIGKRHARLLPGSDYGALIFRGERGQVGSSSTRLSPKNGTILNSL